MTPDQAKARLEKRRDELREELQHIEHDLDEPMPKDWEDVASERQGDEVLQALGQHDEDEVRQISTPFPHLLRVKNRVFAS